MKVRDLKSYLLTRTKLKPFIFRFNVDNDMSVSHLIKLQEEYHEKTYFRRDKRSKVDVALHDKQKPVISYFDVFLDYKHFDISFEYEKGLSKI